jgi:hypothetical protein
MYDRILTASMLAILSGATAAPVLSQMSTVPNPTQQRALQLLNSITV